MDAYEATKVVYSRVQAQEPDMVSKIMGILLLQDKGEQEMFKLALSSDAQIHGAIAMAKQQLGLSATTNTTATATAPPPPPPSPPPQQSSAAPPPSSSLRLPSLFSSITSAPSPSPLLLPSSSPSSDPFPFYTSSDSAGPPRHFPASNFSADSFASATPPHHLHHDIVSSMLSSDKFLPPDSFGFYHRPFSSRSRPSSLSEFPLSPDSSCLSLAWKPCLYYSRGYCKHGSNCRFLHHSSDPTSPNSSYLNSSNNSSGNNNTNCSSPSNNGSLGGTSLQIHGCEDGLPHGSLERLELELEELLRGRRAPVSIASLPQLYYEKFGRTLQAEGYLTESQRHGKAGYSLTKLLARLKNTVTLIDRPHGQHAVVLAEDALRFAANRGERDEMGVVNPGSRQIYLTFPAESTFSEDDVSGYFRNYGPVQDVRIPFQQKRMFGFVTFLYPETVKAILAKGNPHYICGARVLVKPYKEKSKHNDSRRVTERDHSRFLPSRSFDSREFALPPPGTRFLDDHDLLLRRQLSEHSLELRFSDMQFNDSPRLFMPATSPPAMAEPTQGQFHYPSNGLSSSGGTEAAKVADELTNIQVSSAFGYILDVLDGDPSESEHSKKKTETTPESSNEHNLPDSLFASPKADQEQIRCSTVLESPMTFSSTMSSLFLPENCIPYIHSSFEDDKELTCRICKGFFIDPIQLDCNHMFCVNCILKVIRVSKDECPVCQRHIGTQILRLLESRGIPVIDPSLTKSRVTAI